MTGRTRREDVVRRFEFLDSGPAAGGDPVVLHWVGSPKPRVRQRGRDYFEPMTRTFGTSSAERPGSDDRALLG